MMKLIYALIGAGALYGLSRNNGLGSNIRVGYVPSGGRATAARGRANQSRSSQAQRSVQTAQLLNRPPAYTPPVRSTPTFRPQATAQSTPRSTPRPPITPTVSNTTPAPKTPTPLIPPKAPKTPVVDNRPKAPPPKKEKKDPTSGDWFNQMRQNISRNTTVIKSPSEQAPVRQQGLPAPKEGFEINPIVAAAAVVLVPLFGALV